MILHHHLGGHVIMQYKPKAFLIPLHGVGLVDKFSNGVLKEFDLVTKLKNKVSGRVLK